MRWKQVNVECNWCITIFQKPPNKLDLSLFILRRKINKLLFFSLGSRGCGKGAHLPPPHTCRSPVTRPPLKVRAEYIIQLKWNPFPKVANQPNTKPKCHNTFKLKMLPEALKNWQIEYITSTDTINPKSGTRGTPVFYILCLLSISLILITDLLFIIVH